MAKFTQRAIINAFTELLRQKSLDKITVKDVIESAAVNRNTFYYHFQDIYDLLGTVLRNESDKFQNKFDPESSFYDEYIRLTDCLHNHRDVIIHIHNSKKSDVLDRYLEEAISHFVSRFVKKHAEGTSLTTEGAEYIIYFYTYAIIGSTKRWIDRQMPKYKEDLAKTISDSFESTISEMILSYINNQQN